MRSADYPGLTRWVLSSGVREGSIENSRARGSEGPHNVTLTCRSVDRIFLQGYVPKLQSVGLVCNFLRWQRGFPIPSSAAFGKIGDAYVAAVHRFAKDNAIPVVHFAKGENKEAIARPLLDAAAKEGGDD